MQLASSKPSTSVSAEEGEAADRGRSVKRTRRGDEAGRKAEKRERAEVAGESE